MDKILKPEGQAGYTRDARCQAHAWGKTRAILERFLSLCARVFSKQPILQTKVLCLIKLHN